MPVDDNAKIRAGLADFITDQEDGKRDLNTDLPTPDAIRYFQFGRIMQVGFDMKCWGAAIDQASAIMVSRDRKGRTEAVDMATGMDKSERDKYRSGQMWETVPDDDKKKRKLL